jgi:hypothetical protein
MSQNLQEMLDETKMVLFLMSVAKNILPQDEYIKLLIALNSKQPNDGQWIGIERKTGVVTVLNLN